jgi:hypothetical protein
LKKGSLSKDNADLVTRQNNSFGVTSAGVKYFMTAKTVDDRKVWCAAVKAAPYVPFLRVGGTMEKHGKVKKRMVHFMLSKDGTEFIYHDPTDNKAAILKSTKTLKLKDVAKVQCMKGTIKGDGCQMGTEKTLGLVERSGRTHRLDAPDKATKEQWMQALEPAVLWQNVKFELASRREDADKESWMANAWNKTKIADRKKENKSGRNDMRAKYGIALEQ